MGILWSLVPQSMTSYQLKDAQDLSGPEGFNDDEIKHLYHTFKAATAPSTTMNRKQFKSYIDSLQVFPRATFNEQYEPLFRAFDRRHKSQDLTFLDFLEYHVAMKFGVVNPQQPAPPKLALDPGSHGSENASGELATPQVSPASPPAPGNATLVSLDGRGGQMGGTAATVSPFASFSPPSAVVPISAQGGATEAARCRRMLANVLFDMLDDGRRSEVSRDGMERVLKVTVRWLHDEDEVPAERIGMTVAALFNLARIPRRATSMPRELFVDTFMRNDAFAQGLIARL
jgi:hypothetical protein